MKKNNCTYQLSASIICADLSNIQKSIQQIEAAHVERLHFDVMDGNFVPRLGLPPELLTSIKAQTRLPVDVHLMVEEPEAFVETFINAGADTITIHSEHNDHLYRTIQLIQQHKTDVGIALNPATTFEHLTYLLHDVDQILIMGINPGILGQSLMRETGQKIADLKKMLLNSPIKIAVDGGITPETAASLIHAGADILICGTGTIFQPPARIDRQVQHLRKKISTDLL